jgi:hypothetical protein
VTSVNASDSVRASATRRARRKPDAAARRGGLARRKASVVLELVRGADLEPTSRKHGVTAAYLTRSCDAIVAAGLGARRVKPVVHLEGQGRRQKGVIAEMPMDIELLRAPVRLAKMGFKWFLFNQID